MYICHCLFVCLSVRLAAAGLLEKMWVNLREILGQIDLQTKNDSLNFSDIAKYSFLLISYS